jgi:hypothetical protein
MVGMYFGGQWIVSPPHVLGKRAASMSTQGLAYTDVNILKYLFGDHT